MGVLEKEVKLASDGQEAGPVRDETGVQVEEHPGQFLITSWLGGYGLSLPLEDTRAHGHPFSVSTDDKWQWVKAAGWQLPRRQGKQVFLAPRLGAQVLG